MIPYARQNISPADIKKVVEVLNSSFLTQGSAVPHFEETVKKYCGANHAVATNSASSALHLACLALDLGPGDWMWTSPNTFVASANCALHCGAKIDFVDIDPKTYNMSIDCLEEKLERARIMGQLPKIVMPVHFAGQPCDMVRIKSLSEEYGFSIIEDASHAIGASYSCQKLKTSTKLEFQAHDVKVGSCLHSQITVFSFHPVKIITTGEGGMAVTDDEVLADRMRRLRTHGVTHDRSVMQSRNEKEIWNYEQIELGFNFRLTDIQAALGVSQMARLDQFINKRHQIAERYDEGLRNLPIIRPYQSRGVRSSFHLYPIRVCEDVMVNAQRCVYDELRRNGIAVNVHYIPVHRHPYYERLGFRSGDFPVAEKFHQEAISLPMYPSLTAAEQTYIIQCLMSILL